MSPAAFKRKLLAQRRAAAALAATSLAEDCAGDESREVAGHLAQLVERSRSERNTAGASLRLLPDWHDLAPLP